MCLSEREREREQSPSQLFQLLLLPPRLCIIRKLVLGLRARNQTLVLDVGCRYLSGILLARSKAYPIFAQFKTWRIHNIEDLFGLLTIKTNFIMIFTWGLLKTLFLPWKLFSQVELRWCKEMQAKWIADFHGMGEINFFFLVVIKISLGWHFQSCAFQNSRFVVYLLMLQENDLRKEL